MARCVLCGKPARYFSDLCNTCIDIPAEKRRVRRTTEREPPAAPEPAEPRPDFVSACPGCNSRLRLPADTGTKVLRCPSCRTLSSVNRDRHGQLSLTAIVEDEVGNACRVLGVGVGASQQEMRTAYREKISQYHPDKVAALGPELKALAEEKTKEINRAYSLLVREPKKGTTRG
jgi:hypothetical protein